MASMSINISDGLNAKIAEQWGSQAAWKDWVKTTTRAHIVEARKRAAYEQRMGQFESDVAQITTADADG